MPTSLVSCANLSNLLAIPASISLINIRNNKGPKIDLVVLLSLSLSLRFNGHFPGEPGLAGVY